MISYGISTRSDANLQRLVVVYSLKGKRSENEWNDCRSCKVRVGSNGNWLWEASVLLGRKVLGDDVAKTVFRMRNGHVEVYGYAFWVNQYTNGFHGVNEPGGVRYARKDDHGVSEGREDVREVFQQRGSGAKRKLSRCGRNQMGNEPILELPEGADDFVVYYDARSKDWEACLEKGEGDCLLTNRWLSMKKDIASCGSKYLAYSEVEVEYQGSSGLLLQPETSMVDFRGNWNTHFREMSFSLRWGLSFEYGCASFEAWYGKELLMPRVVKSRDEIFSRWGYCDNHDLSRLDNQSIERDRLIGIGFVLNFVKFISFTFGDKEMISVIEAIIREVFVKLLLDSFGKLSIRFVESIDVMNGYERNLSSCSKLSFRISKRSNIPALLLLVEFFEGDVVEDVLEDNSMTGQFMTANVVEGDENPIRTLGDYSKPSHEGYRNTIELPVGNNVQDDIIGKINLMWKTVSEKLNDAPILESTRDSMAFENTASISHIKREELRRKGIKSPSKLFSRNKESEAEEGETTTNITPENGHNITKEAKGEVKEVMEEEVETDWQVEEILEEEEEDEERKENYTIDENQKKEGVPIN
ncbi:hypothetical protein Tco_0535114 [Tanacetum coccineum]